MFLNKYILNYAHIIWACAVFVCSDREGAGFQLIK